MAFKDDMKNAMDKGINASKVALTKAGTAIHNFSDQSVLRIEKAQFESKFKHSITDLGLLVYKSFVDEGKESISVTDEEIVKLLTEMKEYKTEIAQREDVLKA